MKRDFDDICDRVLYGALVAAGVSLAAVFSASCVYCIVKMFS